MKKRESQKTNLDILDEERRKLEDINTDAAPESAGSEFTDAENDIKRLIDNSSQDWLNEPANKEVLDLAGSVDFDAAYEAAEMLREAICGPLGLIYDMMEKKGIKSTGELKQEEYTKRLQGDSQ